MSYLPFVVCILAFEAVVVVNTQTSACVSQGVRCQYDRDCGVSEQCLPTKCGTRVCTAVITCANVRCGFNTICRYAATCNTCPLQPACVPPSEVNGGSIDNQCRRLSYTEAVLLQNPRNMSSYNQLTCRRNRACPTGSDCVRGLCCRGRVPVRLEKPGLCPKATNERRVKSCSNDYTCPGQQKCCSLRRKVCTDPTSELNTDECGNTRCQQGEVCVLRTPFCPVGKSCIQAFIPVCLPRQCANCNYNEYCTPGARGYTCTRAEECGGCLRGEVCKPTGRVCITTPCPQYQCVPIDRCGGCRQGETCKRNTCITNSCASYKCYPDSP